MTPELTQPEKCNCIVWAWRVFWRYGGVIVFRQSRYIKWIFHVAWAPFMGAPADQIIGYTARDFIEPWQLPWFRGHVTTEAQEHWEFLNYWTREDHSILRARALKGADQIKDVRRAMIVYNNYMASLNL